MRKILQKIASLIAVKSQKTFQPQSGKSPYASIDAEDGRYYRMVRSAE